MTNGENTPARFRLNTGLLATGAALAGIGSLLGMAGLAISMAAIAAAGRRWVTDRGVPPAELARQQLAKARAATTAGATAWRNGTQPAGGAGRPPATARR
jgi:hypothetical protein